MGSCPHQYWLRTHESEIDIELQYTNRLHYISSSLPDPVKQRPSFLYFIGKRWKGRIMRSLFPGNTVSACPKYGIANIGVHSATVDNEYPILLAESSPDYTQAKLRGGKNACHETKNHTVAWLDKDGPRQRDLANRVLARLLFLFIDVCCIFSQDCGGLDQVVDMIATWTAIGSASSLPSTVRPRLLVITSIPGDKFDAEALRFRLRVVTDPNFLHLFSSLRVVNILGIGRLFAWSHYEGLAETIQHETQMMRNERMNSHALFSMTHIATFFDAALLQFVNSPLQAFDFIRCSREELPVSPSFQQNLAKFMTLCAQHGLPTTIIWEFIASAIVLDSFPPDMHLFNPSEVFRTLYRQLCILGLHNYAVAQELDTDMICADIEAHIISMFSHLNYDRQSAATLHQQSLKQNRNFWSLLNHTTLCLVCLQRNSEHDLECGDTICDICIAIFGRPTKGLEYWYDLSACPRCQKIVNFQAKFLPPTCRVRLVSMDGGGIRGIVSLAFIEALQQALGQQYAVQHHFDYGIGTSSGGVAVIGLFGKNWDPKQCLAFFRKFAKIIFPPKKRFRYSICAVIKFLFTLYFSDGRYDASVLEESLKEAFGSERLFGSSQLRPSGMKFAVTATTISDATLCLFSNYNGDDTRGGDSSYKHLRAKKAADEILLWEAARCTTAAPTYFEPKYLDSFGTFQDGALKCTNPTRTGLRQIRRIWGDVGCDLVLSIGTGFQQKLLSPVAGNVRNLLQDGPLARVYRASMESLSLNGQLSWEDHWHGLDEDARKQHFRLNLPLTDQEPNLDDVDKMQYLYDQIRHNLGDIEGIARAFKAVSFFFELSGPLALDGGQYACSGLILCRSPDSRALVHSIIASHPHAQFVHQDTSLGVLGLNDICELCGRFQKQVKFHIRHPSSRVNVQLVLNRLFSRSISGFPQPMEWFIKRQKLGAKFGLSDHRSRNEPPDALACTCELQRYRNRPAQPSPKKRSINAVGRTRSKRQRLI